MGCKDDIFYKRPVKQCEAMPGYIVFRERVCPARANIIFGIQFHISYRVYSITRGLQSFLIDVRCINDAPVQEAMFSKQDSNGVYLFSGCTPGDPNLDKRVGCQPGYDLFTHTLVKKRIPKHFCNSNGYVKDQFIEDILNIQQLGIQLLCCFYFMCYHKAYKPSLEKYLAILTEIVAVLMVNGA